MWRWHNAGLRVAVVMLWAAESLAQAPVKLDGNKLLSDCMGALRAVDYQHRDMVTMMEHSSCMGYMKGFAEGYGLRDASPTNCPETNGPYNFCLPEQGVSPEQLARVVVEWLRTHPALLHLRWAILTRAAFADAFPCPSAIAPLQEPTPSVIPRPSAPKAKGKQW
jgi:hypothetical protein